MLAPIFGIAAVFHLAAIVAPGIAEPDPTSRHALFAGINGALAFAIVRRPRWLPALLAVLCAQQLWSHGNAALAHWRAEGRVDWASALVLLGMPLVLAVVVGDSRAR